MADSCLTEGLELGIYSHSYGRVPSPGGLSWAYTTLYMAQSLSPWAYTPIDTVESHHLEGCGWAYTSIYMAQSLSLAGLEPAYTTIYTAQSVLPHQEAWGQGRRCHIRGSNRPVCIMTPLKPYLHLSNGDVTACGLGSTRSPIPTPSPCSHLPDRIYWRWNLPPGKAPPGKPGYPVLIP